MSKQTGTLFLSSLISVLLALLLCAVPYVILALVNRPDLISSIPPFIVTFAFFVLFGVLNRLIFVRLSKMTARSGRILNVLKENGGWMSYEDIAKSLKRAHLLDADYEMLSKLSAEHQIEEKSEKVPGQIMSQRFFRYSEPSLAT